MLPIITVMHERIVTYYYCCLYYSRRRCNSTTIGRSVGIILIFLDLCLLNANQNIFQEFNPLRLHGSSASFLWAGSFSNSTAIDVNSNSILSQDVHRILHFPHESKIAIYLNKQRNCARPQLIGRLSGMALTIVTWEKGYYSTSVPPPAGNENEVQSGGNNDADVNNNTEYNDSGTSPSWDVLIGHYTAPQQGRYFIEIIATMCEELQYDTDFAGICLVDPTQHRMTRDDAFIDVISAPSLLLQSTHLSSNHLTSDVIGFWWHDEESFTAPQPLFSRYQPQNCRREPEIYTPRCQMATDLSRFEHYRFKFLTPQYHDEHLRSFLEGKTDKICIVGASHARVLRAHISSLLTNNLAVTSVYAEPRGFNHTRYAHDFDEGRISLIIAWKCTKVIIGTGQWDAGGNRGHPSLFPEYERILNTTIPLMLKRFEDANIQVYYRSTQ
jgi:hypothetical protein